MCLLRHSPFRTQSNVRVPMLSRKILGVVGCWLLICIHQPWVVLVVVLDMKLRDLGDAEERTPSQLIWAHRIWHPLLTGVVYSYRRCARILHLHLSKLFKDILILYVVYCTLDNKSTFTVIISHLIKLFKEILVQYVALRLHSHVTRSTTSF